MTTTSSVSSSSSSPSVNLGNAQDVSSLTSGSVSLSLAEAVTTKVQPYLDQATAIQTEINTNNTQIAAYQNMQSLLQALQSAAANLTNESLQGSNVFQSRAANLSSNSSTPASSILSAAVANGTSTGNHTVTVNALAQAEADASATLALTSSAAISTLSGSTFNGSITIAESGKTSPQAVSISSTMTLSQVAAAINAAATSNGVTASVVSVDSSHQVLVLSAQDANQQINFTDSNAILQSLGLISSTLTGSVQNPTAQAGSFTINAGSQSLPITVTAGEDVNSVAAAINTASNGGEISASVNANNQLVLTDASNNPISFSAVSGSALSSLGLAASGAARQATAPQALDMTVDGVSGITRNSNTVSDVLNGVTLNVTQASPSTTVSVNIAPNANTAAQAIQSFVTAYNSWESFVTANEATDSSGGAAASAVLFGDSSLRDASLQVDTAVTAEINNTSLGALGISLDSANQMQIDSTTLDDALNNNFDTVANLFQATLTTSSVNLQSSGANLSTFSGSLTLGISVDGSGNITNLTLNGGSATGSFIAVGNTIQGQYGTPYAGMYFTYTGTGETVTVNSTQGIGNQVYSVANNFANSNSGSVQTLITDKQSQNLQFTSQYNNWINEANDYTNFLLTQYSSLTTQIQSAGQTLSTLNALFTAQYSGNG
jgi:flagellar hook-associated protein 2